LGVPELSLFSNGTIALMTAMKTYNLTGEVITTPYSFVATAHSIVWCDLKPVFVDIDPKTFNIDPGKIEEAITPKTSAILAVHVYGNPCDHASIEKIAKKHNLKVIYDSAHAFGVEQNGKSILNYGDSSVLSFHATKVYNTFEGGAVITHSGNEKARVDKLKNFGFENEITVSEIGINGKMNEFSAALGLVQLRHYQEAFDKRKFVDSYYREALTKIEGITLLEYPDSVKPNFSYFPILVEDSYGITRDELYEKFKANGIFSRRYFYPLISNFDVYQSHPSASRENLPVSNAISKKVLCLPMYPNLMEEQLKQIVRIIIESEKK